MFYDSVESLDKFLLGKQKREHVSHFREKNDSIIVNFPNSERLQLLDKRVRSSINIYVQNFPRVLTRLQLFFPSDVAVFSM